MEQEQLETVEYELQQRALTLKSQGRSVRQIAEMLSVSPSRVFRILKNTEESDTTSETAGETEAETGGEAPLDAVDLEVRAAQALDHNDPAELQYVLTLVTRAQSTLQASLHGAREHHAQCQHAHETATHALVNARDGVSRAHVEKTQHEARAALVEAGIAVSAWEQRNAPLAALRARVNGRLQDIKAQRREDARQKVLREAAATLEEAKSSFLRALHEVRDQVEQVGEKISSPAAPLMHVHEAVEKLAVGGVPERDPQSRQKVRLLKIWDGSPPGEEFSMSWRDARDLIFRGVVEAI